MAANPLVYKWLSALMCYPDQDLLAARVSGCLKRVA